MEHKNRAIGNYFYMLLKIIKISPCFVTVSVLTSILNGIAPIANIIVIQFIMNELSGNASFEMILAILAIFFLYSIIFESVTTFLSTKILPQKQQLISLGLRTEIFKVASNVSLETFDDPSYYNSLSIALQEGEGQGLGVVNSLATLISSLFSIGALVAIVASVEPMLIALSLFSAIVSFLYGLKLSKVNTEYIEEVAPFNRKNMYIQRIFTRKEFAQELRAYKSERLFLGHLKVNTKGLIGILMMRGRRFCALIIQNAFFSNAILVLIIGLLSWKVLNQSVLIGNVVAALSGSQQMSDQLMTFSSIISQVYQQGLVIGKYRDFLNKFDEKTLRASDSAYLAVPEFVDIELSNVFFYFKNGKKDTLKNISLNIKQGEHVAIVGSNGSGKSTLIRLIGGLYKPSSGDRLINGNDYNAYGSDAMHKIFSFVFQDFKIVPFTIAENILMAPFTDTKSNRLQIESALEFSGLKNSVDLLADGILTEITKEFKADGVVLSGGELQKLAIARAYIQKRPVIIFDEATSALDAETEKRLILALKKELANITTILVTHRPECLNYVDKIYYMENGEILEQGHFGELMDKKGKFFDMFSEK